MALAAGRGDRLPVQFRLRVRGAMQIVRAVAVGTDSRVQFAFGVRDTVDALVIRYYHGALAQIEFLHLLDLPVAARACRGNVGAVHRRGGIAVVEQFVRVAMAILTRRGFGNTLVNRLTVVALGINVGLDAVTLAATDGLV